MNIVMQQRDLATSILDLTHSGLIDEMDKQLPGSTALTQMLDKHRHYCHQEKEWENLNEKEQEHHNNYCYNDLDSEEAYKTVCSKLSYMSTKERTMGIHELHGVVDADNQNEKPQIIAQKLHEMKEAFNLFDKSETEAYRMALNKNEAYTDSIKLLCLRADYYDSKKAASRVVAFFTFKRALFGDEKLTRDIHFDDLEEADKNEFEEGRVQLLQRKDQSGRAILFLNSNNETTNVNSKSLCRLIYYTIMIALRDEETQKRGIVLIVYAMNQTNFFSNQPSMLATTWWLLAARIAAIHFCYNKATMQKFVYEMSHAMNIQHFCRFRSHFGTHLECMYNLMTFGISREVLPINIDNGCIDLTLHHQWLKILKNQQERNNNDFWCVSTRILLASTTESEPTETVPPSPVLCQARSQTMMECMRGASHNAGDKERSVSEQHDQNEPSSSSPSLHSCYNSCKGGEARKIDTPGPKDILMGRGRHPKDSVAYLQFRLLLEQHGKAYGKAKRGAPKREVCLALLNELREENGCRFLRQTSQGYFECNTDESVDRISHAFRNLRNSKKNSAESNCSSSSSSTCSTTKRRSRN